LHRSPDLPYPDQIVLSIPKMKNRSAQHCAIVVEVSGPKQSAVIEQSVVLAVANAIIVLLSGAIGSGTRRVHAPTESV
jgi:hypothetical protein